MNSITYSSNYHQFIFKIHDAVLQKSIHEHSTAVVKYKDFIKELHSIMNSLLNSNMRSFDIVIAVQKIITNLQLSRTAQPSTQKKNVLLN